MNVGTRWPIREVRGGGSLIAFIHLLGRSSLSRYHSPTNASCRSLIECDYPHAGSKPTIPNPYPTARSTTLRRRLVRRGTITNRATPADSVCAHSEGDLHKKGGSPRQTAGQAGPNSRASR
jgi:hypothetical protein